MKIILWVFTTWLLLFTTPVHAQYVEAPLPDDVPPKTPLQEKAGRAAEAFVGWLEQKAVETKSWGQDKAQRYERALAACNQATGFLRESGWLEVRAGKQPIPFRITQVLVNNTMAASGDKEVETLRARSNSALVELKRLATPLVSSRAYVAPQDMPAFVQSAYSHPKRNACGRGWGRWPLLDATASLTLGREVLSILIESDFDLVMEMIDDLDRTGLLPDEVRLLLQVVQ